jgi:hypothetical protein
MKEHTYHKLELMLHQSPSKCLESVKEDGLSLQYVRIQTEKICLEAVKQNGLALRYVKKKTLRLRIEAVTQNELARSFVKNKDYYEICNKIIRQNNNTLDFDSKEYELE